MNNWTLMTKKELEQLPQRPWNLEGEYREILFFLGSRKSGFWSGGKNSWPYYELVGIKANGEMEFAAHLDDLNIGDMYQFLCKKNNTIVPFRMDCSRNGVFRFWGNNIRFHVGVATSSTTIKIKEIKE